METYQQATKKVRVALNKVLIDFVPAIGLKKVNSSIDTMLELAYMKGKNEALAEILSNIKSKK